MQDDWRSGLARLRGATHLLRDILDVQEEFRAELGSKLTVNSTDLTAMELLIAQGPMSPSALANRLGLTTAATTTVVDRLVALDHVRREPNPTDRRGIRVIPNPRSIDTAASVIAPMIVAVDGVLDRFDAADQRTITDYLEAVSQVYREHAHPAGEQPDSTLGDTSDGRG